MQNKVTNWYVGGYRLKDRPISPGFGNADWFNVNKQFSSKREAIAYIKDRQKALNKVGQVGYFTLRRETSEIFYNGESLYSKI